MSECKKIWDSQAEPRKAVLDAIPFSCDAGRGVWHGSGSKDLCKRCFLRYLLSTAQCSLVRIEKWRAEGVDVPAEVEIGHRDFRRKVFALDYEDPEVMDKAIAIFKADHAPCGCWTCVGTRNV